MEKKGMCRKTELKFSMLDSGNIRIDNNLEKHGVILLKSEWEDLLAGKAFCFADGNYVIYFRQQNFVVMDAPFNSYRYSLFSTLLKTDKFPDDSEWIPNVVKIVLRRSINEYFLKQSPSKLILSRCDTEPSQYNS